MTTANWESQNTNNGMIPIAQSLGLHVLIILFFGVKTLFFPSENIELKNAIRVDMVALPEKTKAQNIPKAKVEPKVKPLEKPVAQPKPIEKKTAQIKTKKISLKKASKTKSSALARIKALQNIEQELKNEEKPKDDIVRGNILAPGTSLTGVDKIQHNKYITALDNHVKKHWVLPEWLASANLKARVLVKIDERGFVIDQMVIASSGNQIYDEMVSKTINQASPFPAPPEKFKDIVAQKGVEFGFPK